MEMLCFEDRLWSWNQTSGESIHELPNVSDLQRDLLHSRLSVLSLLCFVVVLGFRAVGLWVLLSLAVHCCSRKPLFESLSKNVDISLPSMDVQVFLINHAIQRKVKQSNRKSFCIIYLMKTISNNNFSQTVIFFLFSESLSPKDLLSVYLNETIQKFVFVVRGLRRRRRFHQLFDTIVFEAKRIQNEVSGMNNNSLFVSM